MYDKLLLPTDGSDVSFAAADRAIALARLAGATLHAVFVLEPYPYAGIGAVSVAGRDAWMAAAREAAAVASERLVKAAAAQGVKVSPLVVEDADPARGIVETARSQGCDLIVMGSHGRSGLARAVLGSVATKVLALSPVPVMIVKAPAAG